MEARERGDDRLAAKLREDLKELESEIVYEQEKMKRES
jgi:hypothetical protein